VPSANTFWYPAASRKNSARFAASFSSSSHWRVISESARRIARASSRDTGAAIFSRLSWATLRP